MVIPGIAMLALILPSGTEPPSSAMTNASAVRSFTIAKKKPTRRSRAKAAFDRAELELESYYRIEVSLDRISTKAKAAESVAALYRRVIAVNDPEHTLAAWVRIAELHLHFADEIRRLPHDRDELAAIALGPERLAREAIARGRSHAASHRVPIVWKRRLERLGS